MLNTRVRIEKGQLLWMRTSYVYIA